MEHHCSGAWRRHCPVPSPLPPTSNTQTHKPSADRARTVSMHESKDEKKKRFMAIHGDIVLKRGILETKVSRGVQAAGGVVVVVVVVGMKSCCSGGGWWRLHPRSTNVRVNSRETASTTAAAARAVRAAWGEGGFSSVIRDHQIADTVPRHRQICR